MFGGARGRVGVTACLATLATALAGCTGRDGASPAPPVPRDVLVVTIDTARADRFSYTGAPGPGTPRIDALAAEGAGFTHAISPVPLTLPAHASLFTGRLPTRHTVRDNGSFRLPESETTLAELLAERGYRTGAFVGAAVLDRSYGLGQGFATYDDRMPAAGATPLLYYPERSGEEVVAATRAWLAGRGDEPLFAWVHLFDPHTPYRPPEPERSRHAAPYDGEIAYADRVTGTLLDAWSAARGLERTLVVVTSDHGEGLGEHGEATHGVLVHDATLRVPLVIRSPGLGGRTIEDPVHLVDVLPTVLGLLRLPVPEGLDGRDLGPLLRGEPLPWSAGAGYAESLYAELHHGCTPLFAMREARWKLVHGPADELYDLARDPHELDDLARDEPQRTDSLRAALESVLAGARPDAAERTALDAEARERLQALGYAAFGSAPSDPAGPRCGPRDALRSLSAMADADRAFVRGDARGAVEAYRAVIEAEPANVDARVRLAGLLSSAGRGDAAATLLAEAVALDPGEPELHRQLGRALESLGRYGESLAAYDAGLRLHPAARALRDGRWRSLNQLGRDTIVLEEATRAVEADPSDGMARYARAIACCGQPLEAYVAALERELRELPGDPILETALARATDE